MCARVLCRHKAEAEWRLDAVEAANPELRVVRVRPGLVFKREAASGIRRLFAGPLLPTPLLHPSLLRVLPDIPGLRVQAVHAHDVARAYLETVVRDVRGAFNLAAEPVLDASTVAAALGARTAKVPVRAARAVTAAVGGSSAAEPAGLARSRARRASHVLRPGTRRARVGTDVSSLEALRELLDGMRDGAGGPTPPLERTRAVRRERAN